MKTLANIRLFAFCMLLSALAFTGCNPPDCCNSNLFGASQVSITIDGKGNPKLLDITCPLPWVLQTTLPPWLIMTPTAFGGATTVTFSAVANPGSRSRSVALTLLADNGDKLTINVVQSSDPLLDFKANDRPRWEDDGNVPVIEYSDEHPYIYINEPANVSMLFRPVIPYDDRFKAGRIKVDETSAVTVSNIVDFEIIGFDSDPVAGGVGIYTGYLYTPISYGGITLDYLEVVKIVGDKLWIVFKVNNGDPERRIVQ